MDDLWLGRAGAALLLGALALLGWALYGPASAWAGRYLARLQHDLDFLRVSLPAKRVLIGQALALIGGSTLAGLGALLFGAALAALAFCPPFVLARRRAARVLAVEAQIEPWLTALASALRASPSLGEALGVTSRLMSDPMSSEIELITSEYELGCPLDQALTRAADRLGSRTFRAAVGILKTARRSGGNLPEILETSASSLREMARLEGVVRTKTAEGKAQAFVIGAIPAPLYLGVRVLSPEFFRPLETTFTGHLIFAAAGALWLCAILLSRKILDVDI